MTIENISRSISSKECCRPQQGLNPRPPGLQLDGASNRATEAGNPVKTATDHYNLEILPHPSYSPDLSPCDYDLFPKLKMSLWAVRFEDLDELKVAMAIELHRITLGCLVTGILGVPEIVECSHSTEGTMIVNKICPCLL